MIVRRSLHLRRLLSSIGPQFLLLLAFDVLVTHLDTVGGWTRLGQDDLPLPLFGTAVAPIVTLRNNAAYDLHQMVGQTSNPPAVAMPDGVLS